MKKFKKGFRSAFIYTDMLIFFSSRLKVHMYIYRILFVVVFGLLCFCSGCRSIFKGVSTFKDIEYVISSDSVAISERHKLDIYKPKKAKELKSVLIFVHGGNWNSGDKKTYKFFGNRLARKGIVAVVINYRLSPTVQYNSMALDAAIATKWVYLNIQNYGGDPKEVFISGHSAGGHLASLIALDSAYFESFGIENPLKGVVLIDAAGLDMYSYLKEQKLEEGTSYLKTFTNKPETWKSASPIYYLKQDMVPLLIYRGGKTYPSIIKSTDTFVDSLRKYTPQPNYLIQKNKRHIPMIVQFLFTPNRRYKEILSFIEDPENFSLKE